MESRSSSDAGQSVYSPLVLSVYDWYVLNLSCRVIWRCPSSELLAHYDRHVGRVHLDVGVGTGYFLDRARFPDHPEITLFDLNPNSLEHARARIARYGPQTLRGDALEPNDLPREHFDSVALGFLLHCLPDGGEGKWRALTHLAPTLKRDGTLFGSTIVGASAPLARQRWLMNVYNRKGIFSNASDTVDRLRAELSSRFDEVEVEQRGVVALFSARGARGPQSSGATAAGRVGRLST